MVLLQTFNIEPFSEEGIYVSNYAEGYNEPYLDQLLKVINEVGC
jgi:hypothetical protein